jgi:hypothetical protein
MILSKNTAASGSTCRAYSIALYNPPVRVAEAFAMLDVCAGA